MSAPLLSERVRLLDNVLAGSRNTLATAVRTDLDPVELHLRSVPFERIKQLTAILRDGQTRAADEVDTISTHLLLADYVAAVARLRAVAQLTAERIDAVPAALKPARAFVNRRAKLLAKRKTSAPD